MKTAVLFLLMFLVSCAGYVDGIHNQIDREEGRGKVKAKAQTDHFAHYRRLRPERDKRPVRDPVTFSLNGSGPGSQQRPAVKRDYRPQRHKASDFQDNESDGSLWANQGSSSSLFTYQNDKHTGDMVIINVLENLRNQISSELKRTFPDKPKKAKKEDGKEGEKAAAAAPAAPANPNEQEMDMKVYDKISGTVTEEISKDYILLKGIKEVIFKKEKRAIEVQALVSRKDIMENDYVNSDKLLESRVFILNREEQ